MSFVARSEPGSSDTHMIRSFRGARASTDFMRSPVSERTLPTINVGDFELSVVSDGTYYADGGAMFGVVPKPMWEKRLPADDRNRVRLGLNSLLVRTGEHNIIIDTGVGNKLDSKLLAVFEPQLIMMENFARTGLAFDDIDIVVNTHLHFDHCGWNTTRGEDGAVRPTFPRAKYYIQRGELEHAHEQHERDRSSYITDNYDPLVRSGQAVLLNGDTEIIPGIRVQVCPGHTRHHQCVFITSAGKTACYIGDLVPTTAHIKPTWVMGYDLFPLDTIANRHRYYEEAVPQRWLTIFTHDADTPFAYITRDAKGNYATEAVMPAP